VIVNKVIFKTELKLSVQTVVYSAVYFVIFELRVTYVT